MRESSFQWVCEALNVRLKASRILRLMWVEGYGSKATSRELNISQPLASMTSGRHLRRAEQRAEAARKAAEQVAELRQAQAALAIAEAKGEADDIDRAKVIALEILCTEDLRLLAMEHQLWRTHFFEDPPPDHEENPSALPGCLSDSDHAKAILVAQRGPRKKAPPTPEYDANGRRVGAPATLLTPWEVERICERVKAERGITRDIQNPPL